MLSAEQLLGRWRIGQVSGRDIIEWATTLAQQDSARHPVLIDIACLSGSTQDDVDRAPQMLEDLVRETVDFDISTAELLEQVKVANETSPRSSSEPLDAEDVPTVLLGVCPQVLPHWIV